MSATTTLQIPDDYWVVTELSTGLLVWGRGQDTYGEAVADDLDGLVVEMYEDAGIPFCVECGLPSHSCFPRFHDRSESDYDWVCADCGKDRAYLGPWA